MFRIESVAVRGKVFLSPMAAITDSPYRRLCRRMGSGFSFTEFASTDALVRNHPATLRRFAFLEEERPVIFQIFGKNADTLAEAALLAQEMGADVVDLNMGCSVRKVAMRGAGAGLLRDVGGSAKIIRAIKKKIDIPLSAKIRLGWDDSSRNYIEIARMLEDGGVAMVSVHGRTRVQGYGGRADWEAIAEIKRALNIPVLGNGDVSGYREALEKIERYGVDGVLIGRAAIGNPWIFGASENPSVSEIIAVSREHLNALREFYRDLWQRQSEKSGRPDRSPEDYALIIFRKHAARYFCGFPGAVDVRRRLMSCLEPDEFEAICEELEQQAGNFRSRRERTEPEVGMATGCGRQQESA